MTPQQLAEIHAASFQRPRPWSADEIAALASSQGVFLLEAEAAFLIGRVIAGEAELLTIAVSPTHRRKGAGRDLVRRFVATARQVGADSAFLEVASDNGAAKALYLATGWQQVGLRKGYYAAGVDALVMRLDLTENAGAVL